MRNLLLVLFAAIAIVGTGIVVSPADPVGIDDMSRIYVTPDGKAYCHDYLRWLSQLFVVEGLQ